MDTETPDAAPTSIDIATDPRAIARNLRVVDAATGEVIAKVIGADADLAKVRRFAIDCNGNLLREHNAFVVVDEARAVRIEWIDPPAPHGDDLPSEAAVA